MVPGDRTELTTQTFQFYWISADVSNLIACGAQARLKCKELVLGDKLRTVLLRSYGKIIKLRRSKDNGLCRRENYDISFS